MFQAELLDVLLYHANVVVSQNSIFVCLFVCLFLKIALLYVINCLIAQFSGPSLCSLLVNSQAPDVFRFHFLWKATPVPGESTHTVKQCVLLNGAVLNSEQTGLTDLEYDEMSDAHFSTRGK